MFDGEMVKRNFPFENKFGQKFLVLDLKIFGPRQSLT